MSVRLPFGKYELVERLASGGMGETWLADLVALEGVSKQVLIKKMLPDLAESPARVKAFIDEARVTATLSHGNIAQLFDFGQVGGDYFLALEYVHGQSLERVIARAKKRSQPRLPFAISVHIVAKLCEALHYAHTRFDSTGHPLNLVHRDVSPDNLLVSYDGEVKLVDFGVAKTSELGRSQTAPGMVKGKYRYHSPEQALAEKLDRRSDVFGAGIVLFELLSGGAMFRAEGYVAMQQVADGDIPHLRVRAPDVPEPLVEVAMKALAKNREDRFDSALQMQEQLSRWLVKSCPEFSSELLRELMGELFEPELIAEGRRPARSPATAAKLHALAPAGKATDQVPAVSGKPSRALPLVAVGVVLVAAVATLYALLRTPERAGCERAGEVALEHGDDRAARLAIEQCLGTAVATPAETAALARVADCANQRARLAEAEMGLSVNAPDRAERALGFVPSSCTVALHGELLGRVRKLRDQLQAAAAQEALDKARVVAQPQTQEDSDAANLVVEVRKRLVLKTREGFVAAKPLAEKCVKLYPKYAECWLVNGAVLANLGRAAEGAHAYETFLKLAPNHEKAPGVRQLLDAYAATKH